MATYKRPEDLLRKSTLEKLSSPEQLDVLMRVTSPMGWVALTAVGALIVAAIVWSLVFDMSVRVDGQGILLRGENVQAVEIAGTGGTVQSIDVKKGEVVKPGQVVAKLSLPDIENQLATARAQLQEMSAQESAAGSDMAQIRGGLRAQLGRLQEQRRLKAQMVAKGLATGSSLLQIDQQISNIQSSLLQSQIGSGDRGIRVGDKKLEVQQLEAKLANDTLVKAAAAGRVVAVLAGPGDQVRPGDRLMTLESETAPIRFIAFVALTEGKKLQNGMDAHISPSNVKAEEFGFILGKVDTVSEFAATPEELQRTLNNDQLAKQFAENSPFQVSVEPIKDEKTPSGFKWTSSQGPPIQIGSGTFCTMQVIVERRKPISYVIPTIKSALGLS
jgi:HlyD family secretion protein